MAKTKFVRECSNCGARSHIYKSKPVYGTTRCPKCGKVSFRLREHGKF